MDTATVTRTTVGLLFSDIEGSTRLLQQLGGDYARVLLDHQDLLRAAFAAHGGEEQGTEGDSFFVTFASASDAVAAALAGQRALAAHPWPANADVRVRMGVHVGEIQIVAGNIVGLAVHEAARVGAAGHGGQVLASTLAAELAGPLPDGATWVDLGHHELKDIAAPMHLLQLAHGELAHDFPPPRSSSAGRNNLPAQTSAFIGRSHEMREVSELLAATRLLTITGAGGAGKSRLALRVAADHGGAFPDGVWFVDLAPVSDASAVLQHVVAGLGMPEVAAADLTAAIGGRRLLLLIDNCEHLVSAVGEVSDLLLRGCAGVTILATSREPLGLHGEVAWRVPSLEHADAIALFAARARAVNPRFDVTDANRAALDDVVARLDAIPLALELAAARLGSLTVEQVAGRLDQRFRLLTGGARGALARQRTLQATVDWSYDLLDKDAQIVLRRLGVFVGGFSLEGAEAVCACDDVDVLEVFDQVDQLVAKSLVTAEAHGETVRYRLLETIRQYALDALVKGGEVHVVRDAHLTWVEQLVREAEPTIWFGGDHEAKWLKRLDDEHSNIGAGFDWAVEADQLSAASTVLIVVLMWFLARGRAREGLEWCGRLEAAGGSDEDRAYAAVVRLLLADNYGGDTQEMIDRVVRDRNGLKESTRPWLAPVADGYLAVKTMTPSDPAGAIAACEAAVRAARGTNAAALGMTLQALSWAHAGAGDLVAARAVGEEGLNLIRNAGSSVGESRMGVTLARLAVAGGDLDAAWRYAEQGVEAARRTDDVTMALHGTAMLAYLLCQRGDALGARDVLLSLLDRAAEWQSDEQLAYIHNELAWYSVLAGDGESAAAHVTLALRMQSDDAPSRAVLLHTAGEAARLSGDLHGAWHQFRQALDRFELADLSDLGLLASLAEGVAGVRLDVHDPLSAVHLLAAAAAHRPTNPPVLEPYARALAELLTQARAPLGDVAFEAAWAAGTALDLHDALAEVLALPAPLRS